MLVAKAPTATIVIMVMPGNLNITAVIMMEIQVITMMAPPAISMADVTIKTTTRTDTGSPCLQK